MTDADDSAAAITEPASPSVAERLLALQQIDTEADQLRIRRDRLPERDEFATQTALVEEWKRRRAEMVARLGVLADSVEAAEEAGAALTADRRRFEAQLKTVIAPREAEALMHEIATVDERRDALDDEELAALEEQAALDDDLTAHLLGEEALRATLRRADDALAMAVADIDAELAGLDERRTAGVAAIDAGVLARYDRVRAASGVAVAELKGHRCEGCHLDLSAAEVDTAKDEAAATGLADCPQCGRMLVI